MDAERKTAPGSNNENPMREDKNKDQSNRQSGRQSNNERTDFNRSHKPHASSHSGQFIHSDDAVEGDRDDY